MKLKALVKAKQKKNDPSKKWVEEEPYPKWLEIDEYIIADEIVGFFLLYYNDKGKVYCDDFYLKLEDAVNNAYWSCHVEPEDWRIVKPDNWTKIKQIDAE